MFRVFIKSFAEKDATDAATWYNQQRDGLGVEFYLL
jgi:hypothetical protein